MRIVIQKVLRAHVTIDEKVVGAIEQGLLLFLGVHKEDKAMDLDEFVEKLIYLRIFEDEKGKMNRSLQETNGSILCVSQFTLYGDITKGRRPSFGDAAPPLVAKPLYDYFVESLKNKIGNDRVKTGKFGAHMKVHLVNDGPVTFIFE